MNCEGGWKDLETKVLYSQCMKVVGKMFLTCGKL